MDINQTSVPNQNFQYAGFRHRFLAYWVDILLLLPLGIILQEMLGNDPFAALKISSAAELAKIQSSPNSLTGIVISLIFSIIFYLIFWVNYDGATPGKKLMAIKIVKDNGEKLTYPVAFIRYIGFLISSITIFFFSLGFLWVIWDKKKQALHDKIAGTIVIKTDQRPRTGLAIFLTLFAFFLFFSYMIAIMYVGAKIGLEQTKNRQTSITESVIQEKLKDNSQKDKDKILSFAPSGCGLSIPVPKTTDTVLGKDRKWLFEEVLLNPSAFYVLDKDVYSTKEVQGSFIGYKDAASRLGGSSFSVAFPGLNIYCVNNTKLLTLEEYVSLALTNKNYKVETQKKTYWGEVELIPITLQGKDENGKEFRDFAYLGVARDKSKLLYIRIWSVDKNDVNKTTLDEDLDIIVRNLRYRNSDGSPMNIESKSNVSVEVNNNVKGASTTNEVVQPLK